MMRRIVFAGVIISLSLFKYLKEKSLYIILYLIPIIVFNSILYYKNNPDMPLSQMQKNISILPKGEILLQSHYYLPFTNYEGKVLWIGSDDLNQIEGLLKSGKRVFITKESVTAPYMLVVGNNYHITSLNRVGDSPSRILFSKYQVKLYKNNFEFILPPDENVSTNAGEAVVFYNNNFGGRLSRMRINYGDILTWVWAITFNHRDSTGWTYKDVTGAWVYP